MSKPTRFGAIMRAGHLETQSNSLDIFSTPVGWFALVGDPHRLGLLTFGHASFDAAARAAEAQFAGPLRQRRFHPQLATRLADFTCGARDGFLDVQLEWPQQTPFQKAVLRCCRQIAWGTTCTYGELACRAGFPGAARAVGQVMASNRFPLIVPCHRVIASNGSLGGFSAPQGTRMKKRLLALEASHASQWRAVPLQVG